MTAQQCQHRLVEPFISGEGITLWYACTTCGARWDEPPAPTFVGGTKTAKEHKVAQGQRADYSGWVGLPDGSYVRAKAVIAVMPGKLPGSSSSIWLTYGAPIEVSASAENIMQAVDNA